MGQIKSILKQNGLSVTQGRERILQLFLQDEGALAHSDIEKGIGEYFDRVTVYRTLQSFVEKGIIHRIPTEDNVVKYALCKDNCSEGRHHDHHVHLVCTRCDTTFCLEEVAIPPIQVPEGVKVENVQVIVTGFCKNCNTGA